MEQEEDFGLDHTVDNRCWPSFLKATLHKNSVHVLGPSTRHNDFISYFQGYEMISENTSMASSSQFDAEESMDAARKWLEECDNYQGCQALVDVDSGWSGFAVGYLEYIKEETPKRPIVSFPTLSLFPLQEHKDIYENQNPESARLSLRDRQSLRDVNIGLAWENLSDISSLVIPLSVQPLASAILERQKAATSIHRSTFENADKECKAWFPFLQEPNIESHYQTSGILALALDAWTSSFRRDISTESETALIGTGEGMLHHVNDREYPHKDVDKSTLAPLSGLSASANMEEVVNRVRGSSGMNIASLSAALPFPHPRASASRLHDLFDSCSPLHLASVSQLTPMSYMHGVSSSDIDKKTSQPFSNQLVLRGVADAYGRVYCALDNYLSRTSSSLDSVSSCVIRQPMRVPLSFPRNLFRGRNGATRQGMGTEFPITGLSDGYSHDGGVIINGIRCGWNCKPYPCRSGDSLGLSLYTVEGYYQQKTDMAGSSRIEGQTDFPELLSSLVNVEINKKFAPAVHTVLARYEEASKNRGLLNRIDNELSRGVGYSLLEGSDLTMARDKLASRYDSLTLS